MTSVANTVVRAWEQVQETAEWQRPAALLSALSCVPLSETMTLGVARRDAALLAWRATLFGASWMAFAQCPRCDAILEYELPVGREAFTAPSDEIEIEADGKQWLVRWPDSCPSHRPARRGQDQAEGLACGSGRRSLRRRPSARTAQFE